MKQLIKEANKILDKADTQHGTGNLTMENEKQIISLTENIYWLVTGTTARETARKKLNLIRSIYGIDKQIIK